jgi:hypothetical protein
MLIRTVVTQIRKGITMTQKIFFVLSLVFVFHNCASIAGVDALDEVNRARAAKGLRPYIRDAALTQGASACADFRAARRIEGHTASDFAFLPAGAHAKVGGCGALELSWGWGTCATFENWTYAGAAYAWGSDNQRYMQLFVSNTPNGPVTATQTVPVTQPTTATQYSWVKMENGWAYYGGNKQLGYMRDDRVFFWLNADGSFTQAPAQK